MVRVCLSCKLVLVPSSWHSVTHSSFLMCVFIRLHITFRCVLLLLPCSTTICYFLQLLLDLNKASRHSCSVPLWPSPIPSSPSVQKVNPLNNVIFFFFYVTLHFTHKLLWIASAALSSPCCQPSFPLSSKFKMSFLRSGTWLEGDLCGWYMTRIWQAVGFWLLQQENPNTSTILVPFTQIIAHKAVSAGVKSEPSFNRGNGARVATKPLPVDHAMHPSFVVLCPWGALGVCAWWLPSSPASGGSCW